MGTAQRKTSLLGQNAHVMQWADANLQIESVTGGLKITQNDRSYLSRRWVLNQPIIDMVNLALENGFVAVWRHGHPKDECFYSADQTTPKGIHHLMFSLDHNEPWVFGFGGEARPPHGKFYTFNNKLKDTLDRANIRNVFQVIGGKDVRVELEDGPEALNYIAANYEGIFQQTTKSFLKNDMRPSFFVNENMVHAALQQSVAPTSHFSHELPFPAGRTGYHSNRPDFSSNDPARPHIIEVKRGLVGMSAFDQLIRYLDNEHIRNHFGQKTIGIYIARSFERSVVAKALSRPDIFLYQYGTDTAGTIMLRPVDASADIMSSEHWPETCRLKRD